MKIVQLRDDKLALRILYLALRVLFFVSIYFVTLFLLGYFGVPKNYRVIVGTIVGVYVIYLIINCRKDLHNILDAISEKRKRSK